MQSIGMIFYILLFGGIAGAIWIGCGRDNAETDISLCGFKSVLFFSAGIYFIVSAIKLYLGEAYNTLPESFWDIESATYLHYGIVFSAVSVAAPLLTKRLFSVNGYRFICLFDFICVIVLSVSYLLFGRIDNRTYCISYAICLAAGWGLPFLYHGQIAYPDKTAVRKNFLEALPFTGAWVVMVGICLPSELFINNPEEFTGSYVIFFLIMLIGSILWTVLLTLLSVLLTPEKLFKIIYLPVAGMGCAGYLQGMFFNGTLTAMNGDKQAWPVRTVILNGCVWIAVLLTVVIGGYRRAAVRKAVKHLCIYISLIQIATSGWLVFTSSDLRNGNKNAAITNKGSLELAQDTNVLVFVLDNFDSSWFEEIYKEENSIPESLADFTYYRNGTSQFAHTSTGIPYMLTGVPWDSRGGESYSEYAYRNSDVFERIAGQGTDVRIFTQPALMSDRLCRNLDNYSDGVTRNYHPGKTFLTMIKTSLYRTAPFLMKPLYEYYSSDITEMTYNDDIWNIDNDLPFYHNMTGNGLSISENENAFRFYHMRGAHAPCYLTEDLKYEPTGRGSSRESQGKGCLKIVYEFMEQMKALGKYEDATIIITADHGQADILDSEKYGGKPDRTSRPLFLVKKPKEHHAAMNISEAPVSQAELIPTILDAFGMEYASYGRTFEEIPADERRARRYIDDYYDRSIEYVIDGHAADIESWSIESAVYYE